MNKSISTKPIAKKSRRQIAIPSGNVIYQVLRIVLIPLVLIFIAYEQAGPIHSLLDILRHGESASTLLIIATILLIAILGHIAAHRAVEQLAKPVAYRRVAQRAGKNETLPPAPGENQ